MLQERSRTTSKIAPMEKAVLLLVDDDQHITESLSFILRKKYQVYVAESRTQAKDIIAGLNKPPQLALIDLGLPPKPNQADEGFALVKELLTFDPKMKILVLSDKKEAMNIQHALSLGAVDYIPKPCEPKQLQSRLQHHLMLQYVEKQRASSLTDSALIGESPAMQALRQKIVQFSQSMIPVLIEGESGTGKELIAKALHEENSEYDKSYIEVNCSVCSSEELDQKIFGCVKGAFTDAEILRKGVIEEAENGTLFLDHIDRTTKEFQAKLIRLLETGEYIRVGDTEALKSNARIIVASNKDLPEVVKKNYFSSDLYNLVSVLKISVPPLRKRGKDSMLLRMHFQNLYEDSIRHFSLNAQANKLWLEYDYPGNVRELKNIVIRLGTKYPEKLITKEILEAEFEIKVAKDKVESLKEGFSAGSFNDVWLMKEIGAGGFMLNEAINELENHCISLAMGMYDGELSKVANALHIDRDQLYRRVQKKNGSKE